MKEWERGWSHTIKKWDLDVRFAYWQTFGVKVQGLSSLAGNTHTKQTSDFKTQRDFATLVYSKVLTYSSFSHRKVGLQFHNSEKNEQEIF